MSTPSSALNQPRRAPGSSPTAPTVPDEDHGVDLPQTMSASVVLTSLPKSATQALREAEAVDDRKVEVRFTPLPNAPRLRQSRFKVSASQKFETVVNFLRKKLDCKPQDSVFLYVNSVFAPGLDEGVGNLWRVSLLTFCFSFSGFDFLGG
ncbi:MAG: hypothetical protein Q9160_005659 [Pyrenula sp. 1 TL-2023]